MANNFVLVEFENSSPLIIATDHYINPKRLAKKLCNEKFVSIGNSVVESDTVKRVHIDVKDVPRLKEWIGSHGGRI